MSSLPTYVLPTRLTHRAVLGTQAITAAGCLDPMDADASLVDTLAHLMHWASEHGVSFEFALMTAEGHHADERPQTHVGTSPETAG